MGNEELKRKAAEEALKHVKSGTTLGLGSGSTAAEFVRLLGAKLQSGELENIKGVPTSEGTATIAREVGVPLNTLDEVERIDLAVDGADEVDPNLDMIKGLGRALLREKMTEIHADKFIVIVDDSKIVKKLGEKCSLPVEIVKFAFESTVKWMNSLPGCRAEHWLEDDGSAAMTDNGNYLVKCFFDSGIEDAKKLAEELKDRPGVVEHGLFLEMATMVIVAGEEGIRVMEK